MDNLKKEKKRRGRIALFGNTKILCFAALLCAMSGIFKLISTSSDTLRISFENFPIIFGGISFGPVIGGVIGIVSDLLGCLMRGYAINPLLTICSALVGVFAGLMVMLFKKVKSVSVFVTSFVCHMICNVLIKTPILVSMFGTPYGALIVTRIYTYIPTALVEGLIIAILYKNKAVTDGLKRVKNSEL